MDGHVDRRGCAVIATIVALRVAELEAELAATRWQPIATAPLDGTTVLIRVRHCYEPCVAWWYGGRWLASLEHVDSAGNDSCAMSRLCSDDVTHWAPIPPDPVTP